MIKPQVKKLAAAAKKTKKPVKVFETEWFTIDELPDQYKKKPYYRLNCEDSVAIIALTPDKKMIMIRQFRPVIGSSLIEWPAGGIDKKESPFRAIQRELLEETGYKCDSLAHIGSHYVFPSRISSTVHAFLGRGARLVDGKKGEKDIEVILLDEKQFEKLITKTGHLVAAPAIAFYYLAKVKGLL